MPLGRALRCSFSFLAGLVGARRRSCPTCSSLRGAARLRRRRLRGPGAAGARARISRRPRCRCRRGARALSRRHRCCQSLAGAVGRSRPRCCRGRAGARGLSEHHRRRHRISAPRLPAPREARRPNWQRRRAPPGPRSRTLSAPWRWRTRSELLGRQATVDPRGIFSERRATPALLLAIQLSLF